MKVILSLFSLLLATATTFLQAMDPAAQYFFEAVKYREVNKVRRLLEQNSTLVNVRDHDGNTPLHWASNESIKFPMAPMPDSYCPDRVKVNYHDYQRPHRKEANVSCDLIILGSIFQRLEQRSQEYQEIVRLLIKNGACVNRQNSEGRTPLHEAASIGSYNIANLLLENGALIDQKDNNGNIPLHEAAFRGYTAFVHFLLERGAALVKNNKGQTPIDSARAAGFNIVADMIQQCLQIRRQQCHTAQLAFCGVLHPRLGANSPANIFPKYVVQEILQKLHPEDFAESNH